MSFAPIPKTAPFAEDEIALLNHLVGPATPLSPTLPSMGR